jgi:hypothetical protein
VDYQNEAYANGPRYSRRRISAFNPAESSLSVADGICRIHIVLSDLDASSFSPSLQSKRTRESFTLIAESSASSTPVRVPTALSPGLLGICKSFHSLDVGCLGRGSQCAANVSVSGRAPNALSSTVGRSVLDARVVPVLIPVNMPSVSSAMRHLSQVQHSLHGGLRAWCP